MNTEVRKPKLSDCIPMVGQTFIVDGHPGLFMCIRTIDGDKILDMPNNNRVYAIRLSDASFVQFPVTMSFTLVVPEQDPVVFVHTTDKQEEEED